MDDENLLIGGSLTPISDNTIKYTQAQHGPGLVKYRECDICGWFAWTSTATAAPPGIEVTRFNPRLSHSLEYEKQCPRCQEAHARAPEVFNWMLGVVARLVTKVGDANKT
jgi:hypothetical protein